MMKIKTMRRTLLALVIGLGLGLATTAVAGDKTCTTDCRAKERECTEMCEEWGSNAKRRERCEEACKEKALVCSTKCDE